jgi:hypothetical protein
MKDYNQLREKYKEETKQECQADSIRGNTEFTWQYVKWLEDKVINQAKEVNIDQNKSHQVDEVSYTEQDMVDCFTAGVKFARNMMDNPSNTEYMVLIKEHKLSANKS